MKCLIVLAFAAAMLVISQPTARGDKPSPSPCKQLQFNLRVFEGDPLGSREAGTLKVLAEPRFVTLENRSFSFVSGGDLAPAGPNAGKFVQLGLKIEGKPGAIKGGKVPLDITLLNTTVGEGTDERPQFPQFHTESSRANTTVRLGEVVKLRCGKGSADMQTWVELSVEEFKP